MVRLSIAARGHLRERLSWLEIKEPRHADPRERGNGNAFYEAIKEY
jgi:hypothetical protein